MFQMKKLMKFGLCACALVLAGAVVAQTRSFHIPKGDLKAALDAYASQAQVQLIYRVDEVRGIQSAGTEDTLEPSAALEAILAGTGFTARRDSSGAIAIVKIHATAAPAPGAASATPAGDSGAAATPDTSSDLDEVVVVATITGLAATRVPTELREIPQTVSVVSRETMDQQNVNDLADAMTWTTGLSIVQAGNQEPTISSRGFTITQYHVDGGGAIDFNGPYTIHTPDMSEFDHVEVLRGSDGLFGGDGNPGGSVNMVRKRPTSEPEVELTASIGSWDNYRLAGQASGPLGFDGALRGLVGVVQEYRRFFYDIANTDRSKIYATLEYDLSRDTLLTIGGSAEKNNAVPTGVTGLPRYENGADANIPRSVSLTVPWNSDRGTQSNVFAKLKQSFNKDWNLNVNVSEGRDNDHSKILSLTGAINPVTQLSDAFPFEGGNHGYATIYAGDATLTGAFDWHDLRQEVTVGGDYSHNKTADISTFAIGSGPPVNPYAFDFNAYPEPTSVLGVDNSAYTETRSGVYAAVRLRPVQGLSLIGGVRDSYFKYYTPPGLGGLEPAVTNSESGVLTPHGGVVYDINSHYSVYTSYSDVYNANYLGLKAVDGTPVPAAKGVNIEAGVKGAWNGGKLNGSIAVYQIHQRNIAVFSFAEPFLDPNCCFVPGTNRSKGVDAELSGLLAHGWLLTAGYTYNENRSTSDKVTDGVLSTQTPKHLVKLWTSYQLPGSLQSWNVGGGVTAQTKNFNQGQGCPAFDGVGTCIGNPSTLFNIYQGFWTVASLRVAYTISRHWEAALSVNNLFNRHYFQTIGDTTQGNFYGDPRNGLLRVDAKF